MKYEETHLSYEEQAQRLLDCGLVAEKAALMQRLQDVGYYRLSAYMAPFRIYDAAGNITEQFIPGTTLEKVWIHYLFDRQLRLLFMDAIERIEVSLRVKIAHLHTRESGPFGYADATYFPSWKGYAKKLEESKLLLKRHTDKETGITTIVPTNVEAVDSFFNKYGDQHTALPLWLAVGMMDYGTLIYFFDHSSQALRNEIAAGWKIDRGSLESWLYALRVLRNTCAHHGRVWNKSFPFSPRIPSPSHNKFWSYVYSEKAHKWVRPTRSMDGMSEWRLNHESVTAFLFVCRQLLKQIAPSSHWKNRVEDCLHNAQAKGINLAKMGLPEHWESHPIWV
ncbi:MAG: Abi family protein [Akkermansiaceae bacterium]|nr:Abi family protein [Akkermansiaceae bacterium]